jgi:predicted transcriptional regulator
MMAKIVINRSRVQKFLNVLFENGVIEDFEFKKIRKPWGEYRFYIRLVCNGEERENELNTLKDVFCFVGSVIAELKG